MSFFLSLGGGESCLRLLGGGELCSLTFLLCGDGDAFLRTTRCGEGDLETDRGGLPFLLCGGGGSGDPDDSESDSDCSCPGGGDSESETLSLLGITFLFRGGESGDLFFPLGGGDRSFFNLGGEEEESSLSAFHLEGSGELDTFCLLRRGGESSGGILL